MKKGAMKNGAMKNGAMSRNAPRKYLGRRGLRDRGFSIVEVLVAMVILGLGLMPLYATFLWGRKGVTSSRFAVMANQLAREMIEELRQTPPDRVEDLVRAYENSRRIGGNLFRTCVKNRPLVWQQDAPQALLDKSPDYADGYTRMLVRMESAPISQGRLADRGRRVMVEVTWEERGGADEKSRPGLARYYTLLVDQRAEPYSFE